MQSYVIHLLRHGITEGNLKGRYIGRTDAPLAPEGREALQKLAQEHEYPYAQVFYSSPLKRCVESLRILYPDAQPILVNDFRECDFGDWEGKTAEEISREDERFLQWMQGGEAVTPPNGESGGHMMQRTCAAFEKLVDGMLRSGVTTSVIMAHGGTLMSILSAYGLPRAPFYDWMTKDGCGYSLRITPGLWSRSMVAEVYDTIPSRGEDAPDGKLVIDLAREAASRAYASEQGEEE